MNIRRKILIISYHYLPEIMAASYRMHAWAKYLQKFEWDPIIITRLKAKPKGQSSNDKFIPFFREYDSKINCPIYRVPDYQKFKKIWDLRGKLLSKENPSLIDISIRKFLSFILRNILLIPDEKTGWYKTAYKAALSIMKQHQIDIIIATGPPWTDF